MPYVVPTTFTAGTLTNAATLNRNQSVLRSFLDGGMTAADMAATAWVDRRHLVRPFYDGTSQTLHALSGIYSGHAYGDVPTFSRKRWTYVSQHATDPSSASTAVTYTELPGTAFEFSLPRDSYVLYQVTAYPVTPLGTAPNESCRADIYITNSTGTSGTAVSGIRLWSLPQISNAAIGIRRLRQHPWYATAMIPLSAGDYIVGLRGSANGAAYKTVIFRWSISLEAHVL